MFGNLVRVVLTFLRLLLPWVWRFVRMMFSLTAICITSIYVGIPQSIERIADSWIEEATEGGLPLGYHPTLRMGARVVAVIVLILGWLVLASLTVFLIRLII